MSGMLQLIDNTINSKSVYISINNDVDCILSLNLGLEASPCINLQESIDTFTATYLLPLNINISDPLICNLNFLDISYRFIPAIGIETQKLIVSFFNIYSPEKMVDVSRIFGAIAQSTRGNTFIVNYLANASYSSTIVDRLRWVQAIDRILVDSVAHKLTYRYVKIASKTLLEHNDIIEQHITHRSNSKIILSILNDSKVASLFVGNEYHVIVDVFTPNDMLFADTIAMRSGYLDESGTGLYDTYQLLIEDVFPNLMP